MKKTLTTLLLSLFERDGPQFSPLQKLEGENYLIADTGEQVRVKPVGEPREMEYRFEYDFLDDKIAAYLTQIQKKEKNFDADSFFIYFDTLKPSDSDSLKGVVLYQPMKIEKDYLF